MAALVNGNEIILTGTVGDLYWDDSFTSADVIFALAQVGREQDITIRLNSAGGVATEGAAIHSAIAAHKGKKVIVVEGIAASAASVIAMAGDEVVMSLGSLMMVHDPSGFTFGPITEHELSIRMLQALATSMAGIYAEKTGKTVAEARADMQAEVWMTPEEAVAAGYADRTLARAANDDAAPEPTAFDYRLFQNPPERLVALADQRAWTKCARPTAAAPAVPPRQQEKPMANEPVGGEPAPKNKTQDSALSRADASAIAKLCVDGGVPTMAATLLAEGVTVAEAKERVGAAGKINEMVASAHRKDPKIPKDLAATMLSEGKTVEQARAVLLDKLCANEEAAPTSSHVPPADDGAKPTAPKVDLVADMKRRHGGKA